jgi:AcrR family transcriptional regulator
MARTSKKAARSNGDSKPAAAKEASQQASAGSPEDRIIDALLALAAEERFEEITLSQIATRAQTTLGEFREHFSSKSAVLAAFLRRIDKIVLDGTTEALADENPKERLFDVLMRRLDAMTPYKAGVEGIAEWMQREPLHAAGFNRLALRSMRFMLEAADIDVTGRVGALKLQGLVVAWARVVGVWLKDEDSGLSATMAELDRALTRGDKLVARAKDVERLTAPLRMLARSMVDAGVRLVRNRRVKTRDADAAANEI